MLCYQQLRNINNFQQIQCVYTLLYSGGEAGSKSNQQVQGYQQHHLSNLKNKMDTLECFNLLWWRKWKSQT